MNAFEILDGIYYAGVNDRVTTLFEGLWPLPYGVSYNAYVVKGDKTALMDSVNISMVNHLLTLLGTERIDYLVVHHMEPDHSGAIPELCHKFPEMKIVCNAKAAQMIRGFYGVDCPDRFITVKEGDTLDLGGGKQLRFYMTPMVHWPETMMTWMEDQRLLFSGDAFGSFGAVDGNPLDTISTDWSIRKMEMRRYYAAIVAKYSRPVQAALAKLKGLPVEYIASTHGPVWHERASQVVKIYDEMSSGKTRQGVVIAYGSMYGNTSAVAEIAARRLEERGIREIRVYDAGRADLSRILADIWKYKGLLIASPTYSMNIFPPVEALVKALEVRELKDRVTGVFGSYAWASAAARLLTERLTAMGLPPVSTVSMQLAMNDETAAEVKNLADMMADKILSSEA